MSVDVPQSRVGLLRRLWRDTRGESSFLGLILIAAIAAIGIIVGLAVVRDAIVQEFGDVAVALDRLDQSYDVSVVNDCVVPGTTLWQVSYLDDTIDALTDPGAGDSPACLQLGVATSVIDEGDVLPPPVGMLP